MGFGGASTMNAVIRNNRKLLKKRDVFKRTPGDFNIFEWKYKYPEASSQQLRDLRARVIDEKRQRQIKIYTILSFIMVCIITSLLYFA